MPTVFIHRVAKPAALYRRRDDAPEEQPCWLELDVRDGELSCYYDRHVQANVQEQEHVTGLLLRTPIACLTGEVANALMESVVELAQVVVDGTECERRGGSLVAVSTPEADEAWAQICRLAAPEKFEASQMVEAYEPDVWFMDGGPAAACAELGVTVGTTNEELAAIAAAEVERARFGGQAGYSLLDPGEVRDYLRRAREDMREAVRERVGQIAPQITRLVAERDVLLGEIRAWGDKERDSLRNLGYLAHMSHSEVRRTIDEGGKRVLFSSSRWGCYELPGPDRAVLDQYETAVEEGRALRRSEGIYEDGTDWAGVTEYTDPLDGRRRYMVTDYQCNGGGSELVDYSRADVAEEAYEDLVREKARMGFLYETTDVVGVATRQPEDENA